MPAFDELAPDQKAVLQLLLKQGKTYEDIAGLLRLDAGNVRERALDALDALGADAPGTGGTLSSERQDELADHLLLQQTASQRARTREFLEGSAPGRAWARRVAGELRPIGGDALPDIPAEPTEVAEAFDALDERTAARERDERSSRLGGVLVLLAVGAVVGLLVLLLVRGGDDDPASQASSTPTTATDGATGTTGAGAAGFPQQQINLNPPAGQGGEALGFALISEGGLALQAEGLPQSDLYGVWLYNSRQEALPLGFAAYDRTSKRLAGAIQSLPEGASGFRNVVVTKQADKNLNTPGRVVLRGGIKLG
ncbi:MAG: hypothetical protein JWO90_2393 [Solirubrobacterales bacterium]|jgi:hypothetical protein|nr:hypothetical protein [Solirubrobacterales bacterium]